MDPTETRFRCRAQNRHPTRKSSSESLVELQLAPLDRPLFHCEQCGFVNTLIPMCLWCTWTSEEAQHAFELSQPRVRRISTPAIIHGSQLDMSTSAASPRARTAGLKQSSLTFGPLPSGISFLQARSTYGPPVYSSFSTARRATPQSEAIITIEAIGPTSNQLDNPEFSEVLQTKSPEDDPQGVLVSTFDIPIATSTPSSPSKGAVALPVVLEVDTSSSDCPVDQVERPRSSFDSMTSPTQTITRKSGRRDLAIIIGPTHYSREQTSNDSSGKPALSFTSAELDDMPPAPIPPRHQHIPTLRRKRTNLNIQTSNLQAKEPISITFNLHSSPDSPDGMGKKTSSPLPPISPPSALLSTSSDAFTPHVNRLSTTLESESSESRLSLHAPQATSPTPSSTGAGRTATSSPVRIGHPSRPYYSAIRGPHGISPPPSRPTSTDGLPPRRRSRPLSLTQISVALGGEPGTSSSTNTSESNVEGSTPTSTNKTRAGRQLSLSMSAAASRSASPVSPPKYSAFSIPSDSDLEDEEADDGTGNAHPPTPSHGRMFFSLAARSRHRHQRVSFPSQSKSKRASGGGGGMGNGGQTDAITALAHGHAHATFTQSLSRAGGKQYRGSSGGMGFSLSGQTELRMALAEGAASAGVEDHAFKFRETGPPPPPNLEADGVGVVATADKRKGADSSHVRDDHHVRGFMGRVRRLRNNLMGMLSS